MINILDQDLIGTVTVFGDTEHFNTFYLLPKTPRFQVDETGEPVFQMLKYKFEPTSEKEKGGGYVVFGTELSIPPKEEEAIKQKLQERVNAEAKKRRIDPAPKVKLGSIPYKDGSVDIIMMNNNKKIVESVYSAGKPSFYGANTAAFALELTEVGATVFEQALKGKGGTVIVHYSLFFDTKLGPIKAEARFNASSFYSFVQTVNVNERFCGADDYRETLTEIMNKSESVYSNVDPGSANVPEKVLQELRDWVRRSLDGAVERLMIKELPVENPEEAREWYKKNDMENVRKEVLRSRVSNYSFIYKEETYAEWDLHPKGVLTNITEMKNNEGKKINWEDHYKLIDTNDPFFETIDVAVKVNAPFNTLPVHSVEVKLTYNGKPMPIFNSPIKGEYSFSSPDDLARFACFIEDGNQKYRYSYQVNYKGSSKIYQSPEIETDEGVLQINVDDVGIFHVNILPGDINFEEVNKIQVVVQYQDTANGVPLIERQFTIDQDSPIQSIQEVIFAKRDKPYSYRCKYYMKNGKELQGDLKQENTPILYINDPFGGIKKVQLRAVGDLEADIQTIFLDVNYRDDNNNYGQSTSVALTKRQQFFDWEFPVINEQNGIITYGGNIVYTNGITKEIPLTKAKADTIMVGDAVQDHLEVIVSALLLDFDDIKLVRVQLRYSDSANRVLERKDFAFTVDKDLEQTWTVKVKDQSKMSYEWGATFYMKDGTRRTIALAPSDALSIDLVLPEA